VISVISVILVIAVILVIVVIEVIVLVRIGWRVGMIGRITYGALSHFKQGLRIFRQTGGVLSGTAHSAELSVFACTGVG